jgi:dephospho-CoA kinase
MKIITITGGVACGKSLVADEFAKLNVPIIDTDVIAFELTQADTPALQKIINHFGTEYLDEHGMLDRQKLADKIFANEEDKNWLEDLLHPQILEAIENKLQDLDHPYCIVVIPLINKNIPEKFLENVLVVDCEKNLQIERLQKHRYKDLKQINNILKNQLSRDEYLKVATWVIENNASVDELRQRVLEFFK